MNSQSNSIVVVGGTDLALTTKVNSMITDLAEQGISLGVTNKYLISTISDFGLREGDIADLMEIRKTCRASIPKVRKLLAKGFAIEDITALYTAKQEVNDYLRDDKGQAYDSITIANLIKINRQFSSINLDEELGGVVIDVLYNVKQRCSGIEHISEAINLVCSIAEAYGLVDIRAVYDYLEERT